MQYGWFEARIDDLVDSAPHEESRLSYVLGARTFVAALVGTA